MYLVVAMAYAARVPILLTLLAALGLLVPGQARDMLDALVGQQWYRLPGLAFQFSLAFLGLSAWYWARTMLLARYQIGRGLRDRQMFNVAVARVSRSGASTAAWRIFVWLPKALFLTVAIAGGVAVYGSSGPSVALIALWAGIGLWGLPRLAAIRERPWVSGGAPPTVIVSRWGAGAGPTDRRFGQATVIDLDTPLPYAIWTHAPCGLRWVLLGAAGLGLAPALLFAFEYLAVPATSDADYAVAFARVFPGMSSGLVLIGAMIAPMTLLASVVSRYLRVPVGQLIGEQLPYHWNWRIPVPGWPLLLALTTLIPIFWPMHKVRALPGSAIMGPPDALSGRAMDNRLLLTDMLKRWAQVCGGTRTDVLRPVIVVISGGASRAGVWGAKVLWDVDEQLSYGTPAGGMVLPAIFAISSVSGGSVGAAAYMAMRAAHPERCHLHPEHSTGPVKYPDEAMLIMGTSGDALGPDLAGLFREMIRVGLAVTKEWGSGPLWDASAHDRAAALEVALAQNWEQAVHQYSRRYQNSSPAWTFTRPYLSLNYGANAERDRMPLWIGNGSDTQNGDRVLTVPFRADSDKLHDTWPFMGARDALALLHADIRIATAITNTARFPLVSPVGQLGNEDDTRNPGDRNYGLQPTQIADGGYFDNEGIVTAHELATWLTTIGRQTLQRDVRPIIVVATADSDPRVHESDVERCGSGPDEDPARSAGVRPGSQLFQQLFALYAARSGHSLAELREVREEYCRDATQPRFFHFYLHANQGVEVPLNWVLARDTTNFIWREVDKDNGNELARVHCAALGLPALDCARASDAPVGGSS